eukprot:5735737-Alexandrium_andersonii.AAC.1
MTWMRSPTLKAKSELLLAGCCSSSGCAAGGCKPLVLAGRCSSCGGEAVGALLGPGLLSELA